jgi:glycosyltransferase involved in cell wall biosynthesis
MPPRILLLVTDLNIGGTPTVVRELAIRIAPIAKAAGGDVQVASLSPRGPVSAQIESAGITVHALDASGPRDLRVIARLHRLIKSQNFDTVFSFLMHANAAAAAVSLFSRDVRFIQSIQTTQPRPKWHWKIQKLAQRAAEMMVVPSLSVAKVAREWAAVEESRIVIIPNAIEPEEFKGVMSTVDGDVFPVGFLGRLDPIKRVPDLIQAVRRCPRVHLHIFGDGIERGRIEESINQLDLNQRVTMHGARARPQDALSKMRLLVLPSAAEGFGLVLIEAMAAGIPVVATDVAGICDVVINEKTGLLVPPAEPQKLADAIARLMNDPLLRNRLIDAAGKDVRARFTWDVVLPQYRKVLGL